MKAVWITDAVTVTPFGEGVLQLWRALFDAKSVIRPVSRFPVKNYHAGIAACIEDLTAPGDRSMGHVLMQRLLSHLDAIPQDTLLITATTKSGVDNLEKIRRGQPAEPRDVMISAMNEEIHRKLRLTGKGISISAACASSTVAIAQGAGMIASGWADAVLVCCMDLVTEFVFSGFSALQALSAEPCRPFDRGRSGLSLGEGAAALLLMSAERAKREARPNLATLHGWGAASDASHITAPDRAGRGLQQAVNKAMQMAECGADKIAGISAHGTGTVYNDQMELKVFNYIFKDYPIPIYSIKGAIGHTLGAAGGIELAVGIQSLSEQTIPPTIGFSNPERGAEERVRSEPADISGDYLLTTNSGFGGINAAIILSRGSLR